MPSGSPQTDAGLIVSESAAEAAETVSRLRRADLEDPTEPQHRTVRETSREAGGGLTSKKTQRLGRKHTCRGGASLIFRFDDKRLPYMQCLSAPKQGANGLYLWMNRTRLRAQQISAAVVLASQA